MEIKKYPDDTSYAVAKTTQSTKYTRVGDFAVPESSTNFAHFTFKVNSYDELWHLNQMVDSCNAQGVTPTVVIPWLIDGQADRRFAPNQSSGLKLVLKFLNSMKANFKIFHPHNAEVVEALLDNVGIIDNSEFIKQVLFKFSSTNIPTNKCKCISSRDCKRLPKEGEYCDDLGLKWYKDNIKPTNDNLVILLPDGGAFKWGAKLADKLGLKLDILNASKFRKDGKVDKQELPNYNFESKDILIVDDICIYGGTFKGLAKMLRERNCGKLYLAVSHITVQNHEKDSIFEYFDKVFTTNSKYDVYYERIDGSSGKEIKNLEIIKMF